MLARDWDHFLEIQEQLLFAVTDLVSRAGAEMAFPSPDHVRRQYRRAAGGRRPCDTGALTRRCEHGLAEWRHPEDARSRLTLPALSFVLLTSPLVEFPTPAPAPAPATAETYTATLQVKGHATASTTIRIELQRYSADRDREPVEKGPKFGGYPGS